jgi:hypothetical protein
MDRRAATPQRRSGCVERGTSALLARHDHPAGSSRDAVPSRSFQTFAVFHVSSPAPGFDAAGPERTRTDAPRRDDRLRGEDVRLALAVVAQLARSSGASPALAISTASSLKSSALTTAVGPEGLVCGGADSLTLRANVRRSAVRDAAKAHSAVGVR